MSTFMVRISPCTSQNPRYTPAEGPHTPEKMVSHAGGPHFHKGFLGTPGHYFPSNMETQVPKIMGTRHQLWDAYIY